MVFATACRADAGPAHGVERVGPGPEYAAAAERIAAFIETQRADKALPAVSIALVDDQETVWAAGFGWARPEDSIPATAATIYRVGSVSKLFTDLALMQLVERGEIDLDAPITDYLPEFALAAPEGGGEPTVPTLRQLTSHRAGIVREPPVGHYFDDTSPTLAATVASLNGTPRIYPAGERVKYSNAGIATVGYVLERTQGVPFTDYVRQAVLEPLGMDHSAFAPDAAVEEGLAHARMWGYDGRTFPAPTFELGMAPAGSMYAPVTDLATFMSAIFADGVGPRGAVVAPETLEAMLTPQFAPAGATSGFGIGFSLGTLDGHRYAGHGGAIYGFATQLAFLPDEKLGAIAVTTMDVANTVMDRITDYALREMLAVREGTTAEPPRATGPVPPALADRLTGAYQTDDGRRIDVIDRGARFGDGDVYLWLGSAKYRLRARGDTLIVDDRHGFGGFFRLEDSALVARDGTRFERVGDGVGARPPPAPDRWRDLIGEYGWDHNVLFIYEKRGRLHALIEWIEDDALTEVSPDVFDVPNGGLYHGEQIRFERDGSGRATAAIAAGIRFERRAVGTGAGETFTIEPIRPVDELRAEALAASPPPPPDGLLEPDLLELRSLDPTIRYDIRYATTNNFMQTAFYETPHAFMQRPAAEALVRAHRALAPLGYGLLIHDAYRPWYVTKMFYDATPADQKIFVADPREGSRHNRGAAVDLTLYHLDTGEPVTMVGGYDEFSERSYPDYIGGTSLERWHREILRRAMEAEGFRVYAYEWWHFDYGDWARYPVLNRTFDALEDAG